MDTNVAVQTIANVMAEAERRDRHTVKEGRSLKDEFKAIAENGDANTLMTTSLFLRLDAMNTTHAAERLAFHHELTSIAVSFGIDVPPTGDADGGEDFGILSGGGR
jgi:hypothetical protein